jgi:hypothetical protein
VLTGYHSRGAAKKKDRRLNTQTEPLRRLHRETDALPAISKLSINAIPDTRTSPASKPSRISTLEHGLSTRSCPVESGPDAYGVNLRVVRSFGPEV